MAPYHGSNLHPDTVLDEGPNAPRSSDTMR